jgi:hypothetical protein
MLKVLEQRYYGGSVAGELWLRALANFLRALPKHDVRLEQLAEAADPWQLDTFIGFHPAPPLHLFDPDDYFGRFTAWALSRRTPLPSGPRAPLPCHRAETEALALVRPEATSS